MQLFSVFSVRAVKYWVLLGILASPFIQVGSSLALAIPEPPSQTAIADRAEIIDQSSEERISNTLIDYKASTGNEIAILTIKSLEGEDAFDYSFKVASEWGIGSEEANNGVLLFVALEERKIQIQNGRGLEPYLTDLQTNEIIRQKISPEFRAGDYAKGIENGISSIISVIGGERLSPSNLPHENNKLGEWFGVLLYPLVLFVIYIGSYLARSKSWWLGGVIGTLPGIIVVIFAGLIIGAVITLLFGAILGLLLDYLLSKNYRSRLASGDKTNFWGSGGGFFGGSGGFGGGSGGGFGGFGGGSFGGGGSGGSW